MDQTLKQRLVGALVLLSAAVIFLPLILDGRDNEESYSDIQIPDEPVVKLDVSEPTLDVSHFEEVKEKVEAERAALAPTEEELDEVVEEVPQPKPAKQAVKETVAKIKQESAKKPKPQGVERLSDAFTIQLAAFSSKENANKLHKKLIDKQYKAYVQKGTSKGKTLYRVFVGPEIRENRAVIIANALEKEFKLKGMVVRYAP